MQETRDRFLGQEYPLEMEMATHSSVRDRRTPRTEEPEGYSPFHGVSESDMTERLTLHVPFPLQLEFHEGSVRLPKILLSIHCI